MAQFLNYYDNFRRKGVSCKRERYPNEFSSSSLPCKRNIKLTENSVCKFLLPPDNNIFKTKEYVPDEFSSIITSFGHPVMACT